MRGVQLNGTGHRRQLPEFTRTLEWFSAPLPQKISQLTDHAAKNPECQATAWEIQRLQGI